MLSMRNKIILGLLILLHLFLLSHLRFTLWPEILSYPYFSNHGFFLYRDFIYPYPPLLTLILSQIYATFGYSLEVVKIFTWSLLVINDILIFLITKKITQKVFLSLSAVGLYVFLQPFLEGNMLWFDGAMVTPLLAAFLFTLYSSSTGFIFAGIFFMIAIFIKQT